MTTKVGLYKDKRNKRRPWVVRWFGEYDPAIGTERQYYESFTTKREAETVRAAKQARMDADGLRDRPRELTIGEFIERFLESRASKTRSGTRYNYRLTLEQLAAFAGENTVLRTITAELADRFIATRQRVAATGTGYSPWSRNKHLSVARVAFNVAVRWGYLHANPFAQIRAQRCSPRKWHHLNPCEFLAVLSVVEDPRWQAFYLLAYTTGARFGQLFNLTWADLDFERCQVTIQDRPGTDDMPPFRVKDYEARTILLPKQALEALLVWQAQAPEGVPYVLLTAARWQRVREHWQLCREGKPWRLNRQSGELKWVEWDNRHMVNNVLRDVRGHVRSAGVVTQAPLTVHTLRKSFGQNHADAGTPMHVLQGLMGHSSITTTKKHYLQRSDANERAATKLYERLLSDGTAVRLLYAGPDRSNGPSSPSSNVSSTSTSELGDAGLEPATSTL